MGRPKRSNYVSPAATSQARLAEQLVTQTDPLRTMLINQGEAFTAGGGQPQGPVYGAFKEGVEGGFGDARDRVIAQTPRGGGLIEALTELEGQRAGALASGRGQIADVERQQALALATGLTGTGIAGLGQAGSTQAGLAQAYGTEKAGKAQGTGEAAGAWLGSK